MIHKVHHHINRALRWSEKYTKTDMVYFVYGNFWLVFGRIIGIGSGMMLTVVFANFFDQTAFGTYKYILSIAGIVGGLSLSGLGGAVTRAVAMDKQHVVPRIFRMSVLWSIPASAVVFVGAVYYLFNGNLVLALGFALVALCTPLFNGLGLAKSILAGKKDFKNMAMFSIRGIIPVLGLILAVLTTNNIYIVLLTYFGLNLTLSVWMYLWALQYYQIVGHEADAHDTLEYGKHISVMSAFSQATDSIDQLLLWHFYGPVQLATYALAFAPIRELRNFSQNVYPLLFPRYVVKTVEEMKKTAPLRVAQLAFASFSVSVLYIIGAPFLFKYVFPHYLPAIFLSQVLAAGLILQAKGIVETMIYARGNVMLRYISIAGTQLLKILLWFIFIPLYGIEGAVIGSIAGDACSATILWWAYYQLE